VPAGAEQGAGELGVLADQGHGRPPALPRLAQDRRGVVAVGGAAAVEPQPVAGPQQAVAQVGAAGPGRAAAVEPLVEAAEALEDVPVDRGLPEVDVVEVSDLEGDAGPGRWGRMVGRADHGVGALAVVAVVGGQQARRGLAAAVEEQQQLARGRGRTVVEGGGRAGPRCVDDPQRRRRRRHHRRRAAVDHGDDLEGRHVRRPPEQPDRRRDDVPVAVGGDHDRHSVHGSPP
jgi:hypothetical protein